MNTYKPLPSGESKKQRKAYLDNLPSWLDIEGDSTPLHTKNGTLLCSGYNRVVIGDYGAFIEFTSTQANKDVICVKKGQEYRIKDPKYRNNVKYLWYTIEDGSDIKLYWQLRKVSYADYNPKMFYVCPSEVCIHNQAD